MKCHYNILLAAGFFAFLGLTGTGRAMSVDDAEKILVSTTPVRYASGAIAGCPDPKMKERLLASFNEQIAAINALRSSTKSKDAKILVPYLNYTINDGNYAALHTGPGQRSLASIGEAWPAFDVILSIPGASKALEEYCSDSKNPMELRFSSLLVLRYMDQERFKQAAMILEEQLKDSRVQVRATLVQPKKYLKAIEDGSVSFWGVMYFNDK